MNTFEKISNENLRKSGTPTGIGISLSDGREIKVKKMEHDRGEWLYVHTEEEGIIHTTYRDIVFLA